jgi:hypothetical protein
MLPSLFSALALAVALGVLAWKHVDHHFRQFGV